MEVWIGLVAGVVGAAAGGVVTFLTARAQMQRDLTYAYDRELRTRRMQAYQSLYTKTEVLPRYWRERPRRCELPTWSESFHKWYFREAGGLFLSDAARDAYHEALEIIAEVATAGDRDDVITVDDEQRLWRAGQALRRRLAADLGTAEVPRLLGRQPARSGSAQTRINQSHVTHAKEQSNPRLPTDDRPSNPRLP